MQPEDAWGFTFWDRGRCRKQIESRRSEGLFTPPSLQGTVSYPAATGGINWGSGAISPEQNLMVVNQSRVPTGIKLIPRETFEALSEEETGGDAGGLAESNRLYGEMQNTPYAVSVDLLTSPFGAPCSAPPWGTLTAVDLDAGEIRWEVPLGSTHGLAPWPLWLEWGVPNIGGPIVTAGGLVFIAATPDNYLRAFDLATGERLWRADLPYSAHATPLTFRLGQERRQFLVVAAGGHVLSEPGVPADEPRQPAQRYRITALLEDIEAVRETLGADQFHLVGHDWGATVGWSYVTHPDHAERVIRWSFISGPHLAIWMRWARDELTSGRP
ncbi:alpha/beta fold hydrolase, partial [Halomonas sp.]|uniref:alpha/beta fold hydrolase n=1 Tax=Halomonas sp. TaxID=1486246 RepID=UPI00356236A6